MNRGLLLKTVREVWLMTLLCGLGLAAFEGLLAYTYPTLFPELGGQFLQVRFIQRMIRGLVGAEIGDLIAPATLAALAWMHPIAFAIVWGHEIAYWTRMPAGEVDRGTIDLLLSLPVRRGTVLLCETVVWLAAGVFLVLLALAGNRIGFHFVAVEQRAAVGPLAIVAANLFCLYVAVGGLACLISAMSHRRGRAVAVALAVVLGFSLLNFLAQLWEPARALSFLGVLHYYRPLEILRGEGWPVQAMLTLTAIGATSWCLGALIFTRRDVLTG